MQLRRASNFTLQQLTDAYNQTRVDYIVPMPMNVTRLEKYIRAYDVDLDSSWVAVDGTIISGLGMLGVRPGRAWITRVGVLPIGRRKGTGRAIVNKLVESADSHGCHEVWIEVIAGNEPAQQLFITGGFSPTRELMVARRPPAHASAAASAAHEALDRLGISIDHLGPSQTLAYLDTRSERANWLNEADSFRRHEQLAGLHVDIREKGCGWVAYQFGEYQLAHVLVGVLEGDPAPVAASALSALHRKYPSRDATMENMAADSALWPGFLSAGYFEVFRRIEMVRRIR